MFPHCAPSSAALTGCGATPLARAVNVLGRCSRCPIGRGWQGRALRSAHFSRRQRHPSWHTIA
eukprot:3126648-Pyramimonas_sp.AAC.1